MGLQSKHRSYRHERWAVATGRDAVRRQSALGLDPDQVSQAKRGLIKIEMQSNAPILDAALKELSVRGMSIIVLKHQLQVAVAQLLALELQPRPHGEINIPIRFLTALDINAGHRAKMLSQEGPGQPDLKATLRR